MLDRPTPNLDEGNNNPEGSRDLVDEIINERNRFNNLIVSLQMGEHYMLGTFQEILKEKEEDGDREIWAKRVERAREISESIERLLEKHDLSKEEINRYIGIFEIGESDAKEKLSNNKTMDEILQIQEKIGGICDALIGSGCTYEEIGVLRQNE